MLILWDIDHTLIDAGDSDKAMWSQIAADLLDVERQPVPVIPGSTIRPILRTAFAVHGATPERAEQLLPTALAAEIDHLADVDRLRKQGVTLAGAVAAIRRLAELPGTVQSVLTGNQQRSARHKLDAFGLLDHLDLEAGAYGSDNDDRPSLVPIAQRRTRERYGEAAPSPTLLIGDSVRDIAAARANGVAVIAIGTGPTPLAELRDAGADVVLPDLSDTAAVVAAVVRCESAQRTG